MKRFLLLTTVLASPAFAADLPVKPIKTLPLGSTPGCQWCGLYLGLNAGYGGADFIADFNDSDPLADVKSLSAKHSANSIVGGGHLGYNYQFGTFVLGAETDVMATGIKSTADGVSTSLPWLGTTRLRGGFLLTNDLLLYGTGGVAYGHVRVGNDVFVATTPTVGWVAGGGAEYALANNITIGAEYLHVDLDGPSVTTGTVTIGSRVPADIIRGRLGYKF